MKLKYLGTAAAEGYPGIFCSCQYCIKARSLGGRNLRTRSQSIIDDHLLIDFPADSYSHMLQHHINFANIKSILITHTHQDHLYLEDLGLRSDGFSHNISDTLTLYGNPTLKSKFDQQYHLDQKDTHLLGKLNCTVLTEYIPYSIEDYTVTPLLANHDPNEKCFIYLIERKGKVLLYGNDTGWFPDTTWNYLVNKRLDCLSLDCTHMSYPERNNHLGFPDALELIDRLRLLHCVTADTQLLLTHFSHNGQLLHSEMKALAKPYGIHVAYDGMTVIF